MKATIGWSTGFSAGTVMRKGGGLLIPACVKKAGLTYTEGVSEDVRHVYMTFGMKVVFRSGQYLCSMQTKVKDPQMMEKQAKVMYCIP